MRRLAVCLELMVLMLLALPLALLLAGCHREQDMPMVLIPAGPFWMKGSSRPSGQEPPRQVYLDAYFIDQHEVTIGEYARFVAATGYKAPFVGEEWADPYNWKGNLPPKGFDDHPITLVNWYDTDAYCHWKGKRLPTEAEWEKAAYGPDKRLYPWGDVWLEDACNHGRHAVPSYDDSDGFLTTSPVGSFPRGRGVYGLDDMFGNAWEWTADWREPDSHAQVQGTLRNGMLANPRGASTGQTRAVRGGSFFLDLKGGMEQFYMLPEERRKSTGFRCVRDVPPPPASTPAP